MEKLYYMQDARQYVGNSILWWAKKGRGYTTHIDDAHVFTIKEAKKMSGRDTDVLWRKEYIDARISKHVDVQHCNHRDEPIIRMSEAD